MHTRLLFIKTDPLRNLNTGWAISWLIEVDLDVRTITAILTGALFDYEKAFF
jgi:hypothetical protein